MNVKTLAVVGTAALALAVAACGGGGGGSGTAGSGGSGKKGGTVRILETSFPDYLDPGLSYTVDGWQSLHLVYPGLLTFPHKSGTAGATVEPGLAESLPKVSKNGLVWKLKLRKGLKFADGTPLKASDFKASIERLLAMESQGSALGYTNIVGAQRFYNTKKGGIPGIQVDDATGDITIRLVKPRGSFTYELAIPFAGIVPKSTPRKNMTKSPPPGAGPYMFKPGSVQVDRSYTLVRNPNFSPALKGTAVDGGNADEFDVSVERELSNQVTKIAQNQADFMIDNPPPDRIAELRSRYASRFHQFPTTSIFYFFLNSSVAPFNNVKVRQAVNYALDVNALNRIQSGTLTPTNTYLPSGVPGHENWPNLYPHNLAKAKALIREAGAVGAPVTVWGDPDETTKHTMEYYTDLLNTIGLKAQLKLIPAENYFSVIGDRKTKAQTGWNNWVEDYPHPADFLDVLLNPDKVVNSGNNNVSYNAGDHVLAAMINKAAAQSKMTPAVEKQWAAIDRYVQRKAYWAIYGNRKQTTFMSSRMDVADCSGEHPLFTHDWAMFCLK
jgi:peptide/nickel transport system substrate-binding protein